MNAHRTGELHTELENLRLQLDGRPTMRQWTQAQRDRFALFFYLTLCAIPPLLILLALQHLPHPCREQLEEKLHDLILLRGEAAEISMWRQHLSTADRIKVRELPLDIWCFFDKFYESVG